MRLTVVGSALLALCTAAFGADSNLTGSQETFIGDFDFKPPPVFENTNLVRTINLEKGYVRETTNILVTNTDKFPQSDYYVPFENDVIGKIGGFDARDKKNPDIPLDVRVVSLTTSRDDQDGPSKYVLDHLIESLH